MRDTRDMRDVPATQGIRHAIWLVALALVALGLFAGCGPGKPANMSHLVGQRPPTPAASRAAPAATQGGHCPVAALPAGWTWYRDARYSFRLAVPPDWRTGAFEYIPDGSGALTSATYIHVADLFGPGSVGEAMSSGKMRSDTFSPVITIEVDVGQDTRADGFAAGQFPNFHPQPTPVCVGGMSVTEYVFSNTAGDVERVAILHVGPEGYPYTFTVASHAATAARDGRYFLATLATFGARP